MSSNPCTVWSVIFINREDNINTCTNICEFRITGADLYVGNDPVSTKNVPCNAKPVSSGIFSCEGLVGKYLGIGNPSATDYLNISQIRAYSYVVNGYAGYTWTYAPTPGNCASSGYIPTSFYNKRLDAAVCVEHPPAGSMVW